MANRTTAKKVIDLLAKNYDTVNNPSVEVHISSANVVVSRVVTCAIGKGVTLTDDETELIERWLAGYFYLKADPRYSSRSTLGASGAFVVSPDDFKNQAIEIDPSGCLKAILAKNVVGMVWLGLPVSEQTDYEDRN